MFVGIDLGTTTTLAAIVDERLNTEILRVESTGIVPSAVYFPPGWKPGDQAIVGRSALARKQLHPERVVLDSKREIESPGYVYDLGDATVSPEEIATQILMFFKSEIERKYGEEVNEAVITVPAYFQHIGKSRTKLAAQAAGFEFVRILQEPVAAALAYHSQQPLDVGERLFVFDLGGGTLDTSILRVDQDKLEVETFDGDHRLGGADFDACILELLLADFQKQFAFDFRKRFERNFAERALARLAAVARETKEALSSLPEVPVRAVVVDEDDEDYEFTTSISRSRFEDASAPLLTRIEEVISRTLARAESDALDRVALVGGSSRVPFIAKRVGELLGQAPFLDQMPDELVARGAGLFQATTKMVSANGVAPLPEVRFVSAHSLGIGIKGNRLSVVIPKGSALPALETKRFTTTQDNQQAIVLAVYMGEHEQDCAENNELVGSGRITGIELGPAGEPTVSVTFRLSEEDLLAVEAVDAVTGAHEEFKLSVDAGITVDGETEGDN